MPLPLPPPFLLPALLRRFAFIWPPYPSHIFFLFVFILPSPPPLREMPVFIDIFHTHSALLPRRCRPPAACRFRHFAFPPPSMFSPFRHFIFQPSMPPAFARAFISSSRFPLMLSCRRLIACAHFAVIAPFSPPPIATFSSRCPPLIFTFPSCRYFEHFFISLDCRCHIAACRCMLLFLHCFRAAARIVLLSLIFAAHRCRPPFFRFC